jgi:hypothetical protein
MRITRVLDTVFEGKVGWNPSTGAIKPVHIANGLFRALTHRLYDTEDVVAFAVPGKKGEAPMPGRTFEAMVLNTDDPRFREFASPTHRVRFERLREAVRGVLAADKAVFPAASRSALTLTCTQMISADDMDKRVGKFMAALLRGPDADSVGALARLMLALLEEDQGVVAPRDPISFLLWPLLSQEPKHLERDDARCKLFETRALSEFAGHLVEASDALAAHEAEQANRLATLQRGVQFVCLAVMAHAQALAADGKLKRRAPLLLVTSAQKGSRLARASEISLLRYYEAFEDWLGLQLGERIKRDQLVSTAKDAKHPAPAQRAPSSVNRNSVKAWLKTFASEKGDAPDADLLESRMSLFEGALAEHGKDRVAEVLGATLAACYYEEYSGGGPRPFLQGIGKQIGLIFPHGAGRSQEKRVRPSVQTLDVLVKACTPTGRSIPVDEFLLNLWRRFGIVVQGELGEGVSVHDRLLEQGIDVSPTDLKENRDALIAHLVEIGLARRYPDNVAYVGRFNA